MHALVTGAAGFIGSHLSEALLASGHRVRAVDCLTDYYEIGLKQRNLRDLSKLPGCEVTELDLRTCHLEGLVEGVDVIFHQAGQPGVRGSWMSGFQNYVEHNVLVTQRLLESVRDRGLTRFIYASSSSVYGDALAYPTSEADLPRPLSPYGVTKLAGEHLCGVYGRAWGIPTVSLRYFTVYGPRQRPDMAMHRLIEAALDQQPFPMFGDGTQIRDFTYVADIVQANQLAASADLKPGEVFNLSGGSDARLVDVVEIVEDLVGRSIPIDRRDPQPGDVDRTGGSIDRARLGLGWQPRVDLRDGLRDQVEWHRSIRVPAETPR